MDLTKVNLRLQQAAKAMTSSTLISATGAKSTYQGKLKQTVSEIAFGTLAVYVDLRTH
jgi:hypothetical protein